MTISLCSRGKRDARAVPQELDSELTLLAVLGDHLYSLKNMKVRKTSIEYSYRMTESNGPRISMFIVRGLLASCQFHV